MSNELRADQHLFELNCDDCGIMFGVEVYNFPEPTPEELDKGLEVENYCMNCYEKRKREGKII